MISAMRFMQAVFAGMAVHVGASFDNSPSSQDGDAANASLSARGQTPKPLEAFDISTPPASVVAPSPAQG